MRSHVNLWQAMLNDAAISAAKTPHPGGFGENTWTNRTISKEGLEFFGGDKGCLIARFLSTHPLPPKKNNMGVNIPMNWVGLKRNIFSKTSCRFGSMMNFQGVYIYIPSEGGPQNYGNVRLG